MKTFILCVLTLIHCAVVSAAQEVTVYIYQQKPPYVLDGNMDKGLYFDFVEQLNTRLPQYAFGIRQIPRKRLDRLLATGKLDGVVLGANPAWFPDSPAVLWTHPFIEDANLLVSRAAGPDSRLNLANLDGKQLGLIAGHRYPELDQLLPGSKITVQEGVSEKINLELLQRGRIDATIIGASTLDFYQRHAPRLRDRLYVLKAPLHRYQRHLMVPTKYAELVAELNRAISAIKDDAGWEKQVQSYR